MSVKFFPITRAEMDSLGWESVDFVFVSGDAYVDHPSFAASILCRTLEDAGYKVAILPQPDINKLTDFTQFGKPRLGFFVSAGNVDSMVAHYTAAKKKRSNDAYSPGGKAGLRPDRATIVYCNKIREAFGDIPIMIGGIEASLRRFAHYDYWENRVRRSILFDSSANLLMFGMGERVIVQVADALNEGFDVSQITWLDGTAYIAPNLDGITDYVLCPSAKEVKSDLLKYAEAVKIQFEENDAVRGKTIVQECAGRYLVQNKPEMPLDRDELDKVFSFDYARLPHPSYNKLGGVPAIAEVQFSVVSSRGCFGGCSFCAIAFHQGRMVRSRSHESILTEAKKLTEHPDFKGYIHDVGGPTANFRNPSCKKQEKDGMCTKQCLYPTVCKNMDVSHEDYISLLRKLRSVDKVKKVFIRSGLRFDYIMADKSDEFLHVLCKHHVSGQLKVAPEHICPEVLSYMGKPSVDVYDKFCKKYREINEKLGLKQYLVPYLMSSHPGSTLKSAIRLAQYLKANHINPQQVQDFYPTPGTVSTCMYYTGIDPRTMKPVYVAKTAEEKRMQRALLQCGKPENREIVRAALLKAGRADLIGYGKEHLVTPKNSNGGNKNGSKNFGRKSPVRKNKGPAQR